MRPVHQKPPFGFEFRKRACAHEFGAHDRASHSDLALVYNCGMRPRDDPPRCHGLRSRARAQFAGFGDRLMIRTVRVIVTGRVQGVGYRDWLEREAIARNLCGWVRNRRDGSVEALFSGEAVVVDAMTEACRSGPHMARVENLSVANASADPDSRGFRTISTV